MGAGWESSTSIYTATCEPARGKRLQSTGSSAVRFDDLEGWHGGRRGWGGSSGRIDAYIQFTMLHSRNEDSIVKTIIFQ